VSVCGEEPVQHAADDGSLEELIDAARKVIQQRPLEAQQMLQAAAAAFEQSADDKLCGQYCQLLGQVGAMTDACEQAEAWALRGLDHFRKCGFRRGEAAILNILGILASKRADYAASIRYESDTLHICQELEFHGGIGHAANNVGLSFSYLGDFETALEYYQISLEGWKEQPEDSIGKGNVLLNLGFAMKQLELPEDAMGYYIDAEEEFTKAGYARGLVIVWRNMATALIALQQPEEALEVAFRAVEQVRELGEQ
jgi:tetratricopeptide (TPR) repeat protein